MVEYSDPTRGVSAPTTLWTTNNTAEAAPDVLSPLCTSFWCDRLERGNRAALRDVGVIDGSELIPPSDRSGYAAGCFYGHVAINVDRAADLLDRLPGSSGADFERFVLGSVREDRVPAAPFPLHRRASGTVRATVSTVRNPVLAKRLYASTHEWWQRVVFAAEPPSDPAAVLSEAAARFEYAMRILGRARYSSQILQVRVMAALEAARAQELATDLSMGYGEVAEGAMVKTLAAVAAGSRSVEEFIREYGFYGPATGIVYTRSWREDPSVLEPIIEQLRSRVADDGERAGDARGRREKAEHALFAAVGRSRRPYVKHLLALSGDHVRSIELGKAAYLMANDVARYEARQLGERFMAAGEAADADDLFFLTADEITSLGSRLPGDLIAFRRDRYAANKKTAIPPSFVGMPEPVYSEPEQHTREPFVSLTGIGVSPGVVEGTARVVHDPFDVDDLDDGDIVLCHVTDPSWAPIFALASGLVIDIGSPASHGAIVARELGVPCVINSRTGTTDIPNGSRIRIDGSSGTVTAVPIAG